MTNSTSTGSSTHTVDTVDSLPLSVEGHITAVMWDYERVSEAFPHWDDLPHSDQHKTLRYASQGAQKESLTLGEVNEHNLVVDGLLSWVSLSLNPTDGGERTASHLGIGDDNTAPQTTNESLNNEVYRTFVGDADSDGGDLLTSTFLSQAEANGETIREFGLFGGPTTSNDAPLLTHATLDPAEEIDKVSNMVVTIDYVLSFSQPS